MLTGGEDGARASLQLAALTLEGIQAKIRRQAELEVQSNAVLDPVRSVQRPLTPDCPAACLSLARWDLAIVSFVCWSFNTHLDVHRSAYMSDLGKSILTSYISSSHQSALRLVSPWH